ncbi:MAG: glycosyltransferase family 39 protein [Candidatus Omnitrophota bacterium]
MKINFIINKVLKEYKYFIILLGLFIVYNLFFINKAFHIDDIYTINAARAININVVRVNPMSFYDNPILLQYYYAPIIKLFGEKEIWLHLFYLPFSLLAIIAMFFLGIRFADKSLFPVLFLISTPAFLIMSHNIMLDIPMLGFFLAAIVLFIYGTDTDNKWLLILSGISAGAAILIKYSGLMLIPILFVYALISSKKRYCLFLAVPILIFLSWNVHNILCYGHAIFPSVLLWKFKIFLTEGIPIRTFACLSFISGTSVITLLLIPHFLRNKNNAALFLLSFSIGFCPFLIKSLFIKYSVTEKFILSLLFVSSAYIILIIFKIAFLSLFNKKDKDNLFLSVWFIVLLAFTIISNFIAARFILLLLPPMFLLIYNQISPGFAKIAVKTRKVLCFSLIITFFIATILAFGDYCFAEIYRNLNPQFKKMVHFKKTQIYFSGDWGFDYYMQKAGNKDTLYGMTDIALPEEFIFIAPTLASCYREYYFEQLSKLKYDKILADQIDYYGNIILLNSKAHAGFYSHAWGLLPFYLSPKKMIVESLEVYKMSKSNVL